MSTLTVANLKSPSSNVIDVFPGQSIYNPGSIVQIKQTVKTDTFSTSTNGVWTDITGMSVSITPKKTSSKIFILVTLVGAGSGVTPKARLVRDSTTIAVGDTSGSKQSATMGSFLMKDTNQNDTYTQQYLDSPSTTSAITYKMQITADNTNTFYLNRSVSDQDNTTGGRYISVITAMELAV